MTHVLERMLAETKHLYDCGTQYREIGSHIIEYCIRLDYFSGLEGFSADRYIDLIKIHPA